MLVPKEIISPGVYWYIDQETGEPRQLVATPELIRYLYEQGNAMRSAGLSIPIPLEHQMEAKPLTSSQRAANNLLHNTGWVDKYELRDGDRLYGLCEFDDKSYPDIVSKLPKTIRYTSPWITTFTDGSGKEWKGVIGHLALTSRPRITRQEPFKDAAAALSLATAAPAFDSNSIREKGLILSVAGKLKANETGLFAPARPMAFSVWSGIKLAEDESKKGIPVVEPKKPPEGKKEEERVDKKPEGEHTGGEEGEPKEAEIQHLIDLFDAIFDIQLPEETSKDTLAKDLHKALCSYLKGEGELEEVEGEENVNKNDNGTNNGGSNAQVVQESPPLYMSLEEVQKITDPGQKRLAEMVLSLQTTMQAQTKRGEALAKNALDTANAVRVRRLEALGKRMPAAQRDQVMQMATSCPLSMGDDGKVVDPMAAWLEILESTTRSLPALLSAQSPGQFTEQPHPRDFDGSVTEERRQAIVAEQMRNGGMSRPKAS